MSTPSLRVKIDSDTAQLRPVRQQVEQFATDAGFSETAVGEVGLCLNEAMANVIRHAYHGATDKPIEVGATLDEKGTLHITIRDWGEGKHPPAANMKAYDPLQPGGLGLICMGRLMDRVSFVPQPDGMLLEMVKRKKS
ncbi:MAG: ATP-binding protein [Tepidisphaeraceae bacterium]